MKTSIRIVSGVVFVLGLLATPFVGIGLLFGMAGSTSGYFILITAGYVLFLTVAGASVLWPKFFALLVIPIAMIITGLSLDASFWKSHNESLCEQLRADPECVEVDGRFECSVGENATSIVPIEICGY